MFDDITIHYHNPLMVERLSPSLKRYLLRCLESQVTSIVSWQHYNGPLSFSDIVPVATSVQPVVGLQTTRNIGLCQLYKLFLKCLYLSQISTIFQDWTTSRIA
jgi:hypothetical protein